jgi:hypothetical protein
LVLICPRKERTWRRSHFRRFLLAFEWMIHIKRNTPSPVSSGPNLFLRALTVSSDLNSCDIYPEGSQAHFCHIE